MSLRQAEWTALIHPEFIMKRNYSNRKKPIIVF